MFDCLLLCVKSIKFVYILSLGKIIDSEGNICVFYCYDLDKCILVIYIRGYYVYFVNIVNWWKLFNKMIIIVNIFKYIVIIVWKCCYRDR